MHSNVSFQLLYEGLWYWKAKAHSASVNVLWFFKATEELEQLRQILSLHTDACVFYRSLYQFLVFYELKGHFDWTREGKFNRIADQIVKHLLVSFEIWTNLDR